jgi:SAM-dependent methyltransferase
VSEAAIERLLRHGAELAEDVEGIVLDVGCGKGELLVRALEHTGGAGLGIEPNPAFAEAARLRIADCALDATVIEQRWSDLSPPPDGVALAICTGSLHAFGSFADALRALHEVVAPGGVALLGPGYWKPGTQAQAKAAGWHVRDSHVSTLAEWDAYEQAYERNVRAWCEAHADDPDAAAFRTRIEHWSTLVANGGRDTMGYALLLLQRD